MMLKILWTYLILCVGFTLMWILLLWGEPDDDR